MQKAASGDAVADVRLKNGKEDLRPAKWVEGGEDEKDLTGWKVKGLGDKRYDAAVHGHSSSRYGKADMIHIYEDATEQGTWAECSIDSALQLGREEYLFRDAAVTVDEVTVEYENGGQADGAPALADGGAPEVANIHPGRVTVDRPGILQDAVIPLGSRPGFDGQAVSWVQYQTLKDQQADQETIRDAKNQAWAAAKLDDIGGVELLKWVLILAIIGAVLLFHAEIGAAIAGLTGGGGGGAAGSAVGGAIGMLKVALTAPVAAGGG